MNKWLKILSAVLLSLFAGFIGSFFTVTSIDSWYSTIIKPSFNPPNWVFGPVWTTLYILMGVSLGLVWNSNSKNKKNAMIIFFVQLVLNSLWSIVFFGLQSPFYALFVIVLLWSAILMTIQKFNRISKTASYLLIPYQLWVSFAAILNFSIYMLNR